MIFLARLTGYRWPPSSWRRPPRGRQCPPRRTPPPAAPPAPPLSAPPPSPSCCPLLQTALEGCGNRGKPVANTRARGGRLRRARGREGGVCWRGREPGRTPPVHSDPSGGDVGGSLLPLLWARGGSTALGRVSGTKPRACAGASNARSRGRVAGKWARHAVRDASGVTTAQTRPLSRQMRLPGAAVVLRPCGA